MVSGATPNLDLRAVVDQRGCHGRGHERPRVRFARITLLGRRSLQLAFEIAEGDQVEVDRPDEMGVDLAGEVDDGDGAALDAAELVLRHPDSGRELSACDPGPAPRREHEGTGRPSAPGRFVTCRCDHRAG